MYPLLLKKIQICFCELKKRKKRFDLLKRNWICFCVDKKKTFCEENQIRVCIKKEKGFCKISGLFWSKERTRFL